MTRDVTLRPGEELWFLVFRRAAGHQRFRDWPRVANRYHPECPRPRSPEPLARHPLAHSQPEREFAQARRASIAPDCESPEGVRDTLRSLREPRLPPPVDRGVREPAPSARARSGRRAIAFPIRPTSSEPLQNPPHESFDPRQRAAFAPSASPQEERAAAAFAGRA